MERQIVWQQANRWQIPREWKSSNNILDSREGGVWGRFGCGECGVGRGIIPDCYTFVLALNACFHNHKRFNSYEPSSFVLSFFYLLSNHFQIEITKREILSCSTLQVSNHDRFAEISNIAPSYEVSIRNSGLKLNPA